MTGFVPDDFDPPHALSAARFRLEPLGPQHNEADFAAWTSSMQHIRDTPGFATSSWPREMTIDQNRDDLLRHERDFQARTGFTYTVLAGEDNIIGCVYIYPLKSDPSPAPRSSSRGCGPTAPSSTCRSTAQSATGWPATGRSGGSTTRRAKTHNAPPVSRSAPPGRGRASPSPRLRS